MAIPNPIPGSIEQQAAEPRWGIGDALVGWLIAFIAAAVFSALVVSVAGYSLTEIDDVPLWLFAIGNLPLWLTFVAVPVLVGNIKGNGWRTDFHVSIRPWDVPIGIVVGVVTQFVVVPIVSYPVIKLFDQSFDDLSKPAEALADKATGAGGALLFFVIVGLFAPLAEELFFRGLLFRAIEKRWGQWWGLGLSSVFFGATHFEPLQFAALTAAGAVFGYLVIRTGRLGPAVMAHMAFNTTTVVALLWLK